MLQWVQGEHSEMFSTFIYLPFVIKIFVLSNLSGRCTQVLLYVLSIYLRGRIIHLDTHYCKRID